MFRGTTRPLPRAEAVCMGYPGDERKRKRVHRRLARQLLASSGFFNGNSMRGTTFHSVAMWHLSQARVLAQR